MLATKVLKSPPQRAAKEGVARRSEMATVVRLNLAIVRILLLRVSPCHAMSGRGKTLQRKNSVQPKFSIVVIGPNLHKSVHHGSRVEIARQLDLLPQSP